MKHLYLIILFAFSISNTYAQRSQKSKFGSSESKSIVGKIVEGTSGTPLEFATVSIFLTQDSSLITGGITGAEGTIKFNAIGKGPFYAIVEFIGYESLTIDNILFEKGKRLYDLGTISIVPGGISLDEVEVRAERSDMQGAACL